MHLPSSFIPGLGLARPIMQRQLKNFLKYIYLFQLFFQTTINSGLTLLNNILTKYTLYINWSNVIFEVGLYNSNKFNACDTSHHSEHIGTGRLAFLHLQLPILPFLHEQCNNSLQTWDTSGIVINNGVHESESRTHPHLAGSYTRCWLSGQPPQIWTAWWIVRIACAWGRWK